MKQKHYRVMAAVALLAMGVAAWVLVPGDGPEHRQPARSHGEMQSPAATSDKAPGESRSRIEASRQGGRNMPADQRVFAAHGEQEGFPSQRFPAQAYGKGRMQIFGEFWRRAETEWDVARYRLAEVDAEILDGEQSYQVYVYLRTCLDAPRSPGEADRYLQRMEQALDQEARRRDPAYLGRVLTRIEGALVRCDGLVGDLEPQAMQWLQRAAERGYPLAQIAFYRSYRWLASRKPYLIFSDPETVYRYQALAPRFLRAALESGHAEAFVETARAYHEGIIHERDAELAYAYAVAAEEAADPGLDVGGRLRGELADELGPAQQRKARQWARELCDTYCL